MSKVYSFKAFGWVVETDDEPPLRFNVAEPSPARAVELVRLQRPEAVGRVVQAKAPLSHYAVYVRLRLKRGQVAILELLFAIAAAPPFSALFPA